MPDLLHTIMKEIIFSGTQVLSLLINFQIAYQCCFAIPHFREPRSTESHGLYVPNGKSFAESFTEIGTGIREFLIKSPPKFNNDWKEAGDDYDLPQRRLLYDRGKDW